MIVFDTVGPMTALNGINVVLMKNRYHVCLIAVSPFKTFNYID